MTGTLFSYDLHADVNLSCHIITDDIHTYEVTSCDINVG
jgi:hypothetical protein